MMRKLFCVALVAASVGSVTLPTSALAEIYVRRAPPPPRSEVAPAPRHGYAWAPGYWDWRARHHVWVSGHWVRERPGFTYREPRWEERDGRWLMHRGNWARGDRDGDGVPNRLDRSPDNPRRQ